MRRACFKHQQHESRVLDHEIVYLGLRGVTGGVPAMVREVLVGAVTGGWRTMMRVVVRDGGRRSVWEWFESDGKAM